MDSIKLLLDKEMSFIFTDTDDSAPLHVSVGCGNLEAMHVLSKRCLLKNTKKYSVTVFMVAAQSGKT
jgi:hypothetical protein